MSPYHQPDTHGHFGPYGGAFISETLTLAIEELKAAYAKYQHDADFLAEFRSELAHYVGGLSSMVRFANGAQLVLLLEYLP